MTPVFSPLAPALVLAAAPLTAEAATFEIVDTRRYTDAEMRDRFLCNIEIRGPIETGDAERLQGIFDAQFQNPPPDPTGWIACLDSAGGAVRGGHRAGRGPRTLRLGNPCAAGRRMPVRLCRGLPVRHLRRL